MIDIQKLTYLAAACLATSQAFGHGTPLEVFVESDRLVVAHPLDQTFAPPIFGQDDEYDDFSAVDSFPPTGNVILWDIPGVDIHDMSETSSLSIEVLARPVIGSSAGEHRLLWYWNPTSEAVEEAPADFHIFGTGARVMSLQPTTQESPASFELASDLVGKVGFHNHSLLFFGLDDDATAPAGVYGFFARFTSNAYTSSDPFLVIFNYFTDNGGLPAAGLEIHSAATLAGDFDLDDDVDGHDFLQWQRLFGSTTRTVADASLNGIVDDADLAVWQQNYGTVLGAPTLSAAVQLPESATLALVLTALAIGAPPGREWAFKKQRQ